MNQEIRWRCPLCNLDAEVVVREDVVKYYEVKCDRCGKFIIPEGAVDLAVGAKKAHLVAAWIRRNQNGSEPLPIKTRQVKELIATGEHSVLEKLDLLLTWLAERTDCPGDDAKFDPKVDYPLVFAHDAQEIYYYYDELGAAGHINRPYPGAVVVSGGGYRYLQTLKQKGIDSNIGFVAMGFNESLKPSYLEIIKPAVQECGYKPVIMWEHKHTNRIDDEIIAQIRKSKFLVADFSFENKGAYFEAGLMMGMGRPVFFLCREEDKANVHFDTRQYYHIFYTAHGAAKKELADRIVSVLGLGKGAEID